MGKLETIALRMEQLRPAYNRAIEERLAVHTTVAADIWKIMGRTIVRPEGASFALGRVFHALEPLRDWHEVVDEFEDLKKKGQELRDAIADKKNPETP